MFLPTFQLSHLITLAELLVEVDESVSVTNLVVLHALNNLLASLGADVSGLDIRLDVVL